MDEKEKIVAEATEKAQAEAKKQKLNAAQTKLYVDEAVKKAVEGLEAVTEPTVEAEEPKVEEVKTKEQKKAKAKQTEQKKIAKKKYIVHTPVKDFCGEVAGVQFAYGKAEVQPGWILNWFKEHGYKVEEVSE